MSGQGELKMREHRFPEVIGNDGAGTVVAIGAAVSRFQRGDRVYAFTESGGFYAEYVAVDEDNVAPIPAGWTPEAGALGADGITALRGLEDQLQLRPYETLMIFGASGGIGHLAVQLAKRSGTVVAVASGSDGVELVRRLGADLALDGRDEDVAGRIRAFAPGGSMPRSCWRVGLRSTKRSRRSKKEGVWPIPTASSPYLARRKGSTHEATTEIRTARSSSA